MVNIQVIASILNAQGGSNVLHPSAYQSQWFAISFGTAVKISMDMHAGDISAPIRLDVSKEYGAFTLNMAAMEWLTALIPGIMKTFAVI